MGNITIIKPSEIIWLRVISFICRLRLGYQFAWKIQKTLNTKLFYNQNLNQISIDKYSNDFLENTAEYFLQDYNANSIFIFPIFDWLFHLWKICPLNWPITEVVMCVMGFKNQLVVCLISSYKIRKYNCLWEKRKIIYFFYKLAWREYFRNERVYWYIISGTETCVMCCSFWLMSILFSSGLRKMI